MRLTDRTRLDFAPDPSQPHPMEILEPEESDHDPRAEVLSKLFDLLLPAPKNGGAVTLESGWRKFVALTMVLRPDILSGRSQTSIAAELDCSPANVSKLCNQMADKLGIRPASMKSDTARGAMSQGQYDRKPVTNTGRTAATVHQESIKRRCDTARRKMADGKPWIGHERQALREAGLLDNSDQLTPKGVAYMAGNKPEPQITNAPTPGKESLQT